MTTDKHTLDGYQQDCRRTMSLETMDEKTRHLFMSLALAGEAGELANRTKKVFFHGHPYDQEKVVEELGDLLWYIAIYASEIGVSLSEVASRNLKKLNARYPEGFSSEASIQRKI